MYEPGRPIQQDQAWRTFDDWKRHRREIAVIFYGHEGNSLYTIGVMDAASNGKISLKSVTARASFNLSTANFTYGPVQTWPRWPSPPIVELMAIQAQLANGDWLALAEGLRPDSLPMRALPS